MAAVCLSVRLSFLPVPDPVENGRVYRKLKIDRKEAHTVIRVTRSETPFRGQKVKGQGHQAVTENLPCLRIGKAYDLQTWFTDEYDDPYHRHARWPPSWKFWVAVQVTTCRGRGHIVAAPLTAQPVCATARRACFQIKHLKGLHRCE